MPGIGHYEAVRREIIRLLRQERHRRKLSNYAVAQNSGVSESMLSLVERGLRNPTMELMLRISDGVGADLPALIRRATKTVTQPSSAGPYGMPRPSLPGSKGGQVAPPRD